ncbi:DUF1499 domain-containing protein [Parvibaculum sedimenti]|uniref:DUF1499 domain-containing protein n=1 Tax=Parvibaculum sedimenti TaxID=2608632 RepID=A0A6N6VI02_9HYPH|nr:DUF1499 domain-containing protein [Parvibaculum sedimenti]KAB7739967.1 DUF1499 domain-containing protein [Parvibaculum sedimenti]
MEGKSRAARWGGRIGIVAILLLAAAIAANHLGLLGYELPLMGIAVAALLGVIAILVSLIGLIITLRGKPGAGAAVLGVVLGVVAAAPLASTFVLGRGVPRIHDITTDLANPPQFEAVVALRQGAPNALDRSTPADLAEQQQKAYPDLVTLTVAEQPGKVYVAALETAKEMGWTLDRSTPEKGLIEATAVTRLIGFKDDVAIRITEKDGGTAVDLRSVSRVGVSDLGANAKRIRAFLDALKAKLATQGS